MNNKSTDKKLGGKVALVTGASKGIGASIAKHLADEGAAVVVNYLSGKGDAERVVDEITGRMEKQSPFKQIFQKRRTLIACSWRLRKPSAVSIS